MVYTKDKQSMVRLSEKTKKALKKSNPNLSYDLILQFYLGLREPPKGFIWRHKK